MNSRTEAIHKWDNALLLRAFLCGFAIETIFIAPVLLTSWGHAGPDSLWGWIGLILNIPGGLVLIFLRTILGVHNTDSNLESLVSLFLIQTFLLSYVAFIFLRLKKRKLKSLSQS